VVKRDDTPLLAYASEGQVAALFSLLGLIAGADGRVTQVEIDEVQRFMVLEVPHSLHQLAKESFRKAKGATPVKAAIMNHAFTLYWEPRRRWLEPIQVLDILVRVALADRIYTDWEEMILEVTRATLAVHTRTFLILRDTLADRIGIKIGDLESFAGGKDWNQPGKSTTYEKMSESSNGNANTHTKGTFSPSERTFYLTKLGLGADAQENEIRTSYRALVKRYHPDAQVAGGASESEVKDAVKRFLEIQKAYEWLSSRSSKK
jgi:DnaJ like chaperone protein